ncbi:hypothetical protein SAMN04488587_0562 [Methanococcoides vulcani]|uniref:Uncharacterized protein n=1 Tax=Methanococcoides vulcani TaxID=1353158 RepID=A0A1H9YHD8_9EURY|nr:hypothetical protein [Methanococcoides vulcani]SES68338.1 hypothetical protein SAMN04488587_0562 [Methanococcoides vulcani]
MKRGTMKGFAIIAAVLMVVSLLPMTALADNGNGFENAPGQMKKNATGETVGLQDQDRIRTQDRTNIQDAKNDYNKMTSEFQMIKRNQARGQLTTDQMVNESKDYLNGTIDYMVLRLENIKDEAEYTPEVNATINAYIAELEDIRTDVEEAETRKDLSDAMKDIRKLWKDAIKDIRKSTREKVNDGLENYLEKSDDVSERLQEEVDQMEDGEEAAELQELLDEYNTLIAEAKALLEEGNLEDAIDKTKDANEVLKEILGDMKESRDGYVSMTGEGALNAKGDGTIVLSGQLNVTINATDAMLVIKHLAGDAEIDVTGAEYDLVNEETEDGCCAYVYDNFTGDALINGTRLTVMVSGEDLTVFAEGTGSASLSGEGTYQVGEGDEAVEMEFASEDVEMQTEESDDDENGADDDTADDGNNTDNNSTVDGNNTDNNSTVDGNNTDNNSTVDGNNTDGVQ